MSRVIEYVIDRAGASINPSKHGNEVFELFSIPAYDNGSPEFKLGRDIKSNKTLVVAGDVIISKLNPRIPRVWHIDGPSKYRRISSTEFIPLRVKDRSLLDPEYLQYMCLAPQFLRPLQDAVKSSTKSHQRVRPAQIYEQSIPIVPIQEQYRIAARINECLQRVEEIENLRTHSIGEADAALPSMLNEAFVDLGDSYEKAEIRSVALESRYGTSRKCSSTPGGTAILRIPNVAGGFVNFENLKYCVLDSEEYRKMTLEVGDLLFVRTNGSRDLVGRCAVYDGNDCDQNYGFASYLIRVRLDGEKMRPHFLAFFLNCTHGRTELDQRRRTSAGQFNINSENLLNIKVPLPPVEVQDQIIDSMRKHQEQIIQLKDELRTAQEIESHLRKAILHKAFDGEL